LLAKIRTRHARFSQENGSHEQKKKKGAETAGGAGQTAGRIPSYGVLEQ